MFDLPYAKHWEAQHKRYPLGPWFIKKNILTNDLRLMLPVTRYLLFVTRCTAYVYLSNTRNAILAFANIQLPNRHREDLHHPIALEFLNRSQLHLRVPSHPYNQAVH